MYAWGVYAAPTSLGHCGKLILTRSAHTSFILTWRRGRRDQQGGSLRMRPRHCTPLGLRPAISPNVGNSGAEFLVVGVRVRAAPDKTNKEKTNFFSEGGRENVVMKRFAHPHHHRSVTAKAVDNKKKEARKVEQRKMRKVEKKTCLLVVASGLPASLGKMQSREK